MVTAMDNPQLTFDTAPGPGVIPDAVRTAYPVHYRAHRILRKLAHDGYVGKDLVAAVSAVEALRTGKKVRGRWLAKSLQPAVSKLARGTYWQVTTKSGVFTYANGSTRTVPPGLHCGVNTRVAEAVLMMASLVRHVRRHGYVMGGAQ
jgi:hypothetical protein